jgi:hypothetical protein
VGPHYETSTNFAEKWEAVNTPGVEWPKGFKLQNEKLYFGQKLCVAVTLQGAWVREYHTKRGHVGPEKLWKYMNALLEWDEPQRAKAECFEVMKTCTTCQACARPLRLRGTLEYTHIPPQIMVSVALDIFYMPRVEYKGVKYDGMAVCVCRHSGWIVAVPCTIKGLTGPKVAQMMLEHQWRPFGIPSIVTSDRGSHFVNAWWKHMCARLGIHHVFSPPYHHQANGRAEVAGQQIMEILRKLYAESGENWVEALPRALDCIYDMKGPVGYSPYEILFGRERPLQGLPYPCPGYAEGAQEFFTRMEKLDAEIGQKFRVLHAGQQARQNLQLVEPRVYKPGEIVWYRRPEDSGHKLDTRWLGPCKVTERVGEYTYKVEVGPGSFVEAHATFLKLYHRDFHSGEPLKFFRYRRTPTPQLRSPPPELVMEGSELEEDEL